MVLEGYRARVAPYMKRISEPFLTWRPDRISMLALALSVAAAVLAAVVRWTTPLLFLPVSLLIFAGGVFDVVDGEVARRTNRTSARGDFLDHVFDRYADVAVVLGIAISGYANPILALLALVSLLLTSYMGTQAQAVGVGRIYAGLLSRADRLIVLSLATFLEFDLSLPWPWAPSMPWAHLHWGILEFTVLDIAFAYFVIAGNWTAIARARSAYRSLSPPP
ncbi:MAG: CDP-alcohol phosphatidyltransferase family protein [Thermoplasmata archaeon]